MMTSQCSRSHTPWTSVAGVQHTAAVNANTRVHNMEMTVAHSDCHTSQLFHARQKCKLLANAKIEDRKIVPATV